MPLLNYTTSIATEKTVAEIQGILARAGATAVATELSAGVVIRISFQIRTQFGFTAYRLPCDTDAIHRVLHKQADERKISRSYDTKEQAARVGWRIIKDWIEAQLALVETQMVTIDQVFLPYAETPGGTTVYERYLKAGMSGLQLTQ